MQKTLYQESTSRVLDVLRSLRKEAGLSQADLAERLGRPQSYVSKVEAGQRRLDVVELRAWCIAVGEDLPTVAQQIEDRLR